MPDDKLDIAGMTTAEPIPPCPKCGGRMFFLKPRNLLSCDNLACCETRPLVWRGDKPIADEFAEIVAQVPPEELAKLPTDGAENHDRRNGKDTPAGRGEAKGDGETVDIQLVRNQPGWLELTLSRRWKCSAPGHDYHDSRKRLLLRDSEVELVMRACDGNMGERLATLVAELDALRERAERAEAIVAKLPRTADGAPVVLGMTVWVKAFPIDSGTVVYVTESGCEVKRSNSRLWYTGEQVYRTRQAALAARDAPPLPATHSDDNPREV